VVGEWVWWVGGILGLGAVVGVSLIVRHQVYVKQIKARGWSWNGSPQLSDFFSYQVPPFGLGVDRGVDDLVSGATSDGRRFDSFEYRFDRAGRFKRRVLGVQLPTALPTAFMFSGAARDGIGMGAPSLFEAQGGGLTVVAASAEYASEVHERVSAAIGELPEGKAIDLSIDGDRLVFLPASRDLDELNSLLEVLSPVATALAELSGSRAVRPPAPRYAFYGHPDWEYLDSDDTVLGYYPATQGGFGHSTEDLIRGMRDGIRMDAFIHNWKTTETRSVSDGRGGIRLETYTEDHSEPICGFLLPYALPALSVNGDRVGAKVQFESEDFNDAFKVRAADAKFASDVIHPRTMEWLLATRPSGWSMAGSVVVFEVASHDTYAVDANETTLRGFLGRIPRFVWADLGLPVPPFLVE